MAAVQSRETVLAAKGLADLQRDVISETDRIVLDFVFLERRQAFDHRLCRGVQEKRNRLPPRSTLETRWWVGNTVWCADPFVV